MINHQDWQEQIPFYIAQSLSPEQRRNFETHLASCAACQAEMDEWRMIASAVWREADEAARQLPPLSQEVYNRLSYRDKAPVSRYAANPPRPQSSVAPRALPNIPTVPNIKVIPKRRTINLPITLVAGLVVAILFGGLIFFAFRNNDEGEVAILLTANADSTEEMGALIEATPTNALGIIPTEASTEDELDATQQNLFATNTSEPLPPTPEPSITLEPSPETFVPTRDTSFNIAPPITPTPTSTDTEEPVAPLGAGPYITITPNLLVDGAAYCEIYNPTSVPIELYAEPFNNAEITGALLPTQVARVISMNEQGWYFLISPNLERGWIAPSMAYLRGSCYAGYDIPLATPFQTPEATPTFEQQAGYESSSGMIVVINAAYADLQAEPTFASNTLGVVSRNEQYIVLGYQGVGTNRFVNIQLNDGRSAWVWAQIVVEYPANLAPPTPTPQP